MGNFRDQAPGLQDQVAGLAVAPCAVMPYVVSAGCKRVVATYAKWKRCEHKPERTLMRDGWTLSSLKFARLHEAHAAALDLAMVSGSIRPMRGANILITEYYPEERSPT